MEHYLIRTNPKGQSFIGKCKHCGEEGGFALMKSYILFKGLSLALEAVNADNTRDAKLIAKFPDFDPAWSIEKQKDWLEQFGNVIRDMKPEPIGLG